jgi:alpha-galactosidase
MHAFGLEIDGQSLHFGWELVSIKADQKDEERSGSVVELKSTIRPVNVRVHTEADGTGFITRWLEIKNTAEKPAALSAVFPMSGLLLRASKCPDAYGSHWKELMGKESPVFKLGYMSERTWGQEGAFIWQELPNTPLRIESRLGKSGHGAPFFIVKNEATGEHAVGGLEWSGNWAIEFTCDQSSTADAWLGFKAGPVAPGPLRVVAAGETVTSPKVHIGVLFADFDGSVQAWHRHLRKSVLLSHPEGKGLLINCNHWSYYEHEITEDRLKSEIDAGAETGAEVFVIDAGWYGNKGAQWWTTTGDWTCGDRLPNGLEPVFDYAKKKGLLYGMWFDLERRGSESKVAKEHPEWFLKCYGRETGHGDIDLTNPEAQKWLESRIAGVIEKYKLDLFRLDYNTYPYEGGQTQRDGYMENHQWRYYEFVYGMYEHLRKKFPKIILENCAGGGGRTDIGMMSRFHYTQITDWAVLPRVVKIVNGATIALPPERIDHTTGVGQNAHIRGDLDTQMRHVLLGHITLIGFYPSKEERNPAQMQRVKHHVEIYKNFIRPFMPSCRVYHHTPVISGKEPQGWCVLEYVAEDDSRAVISLFRLAGESTSEFRVYPRGIALDKKYRIAFDNEGSTIEKYGEEVRSKGINIAVGHALGSELLLFEAI